ncbi:hypothetical protein SOPP22_05660 [Shewanella sp. OPT22]|nr:hypothetical protein SOPP22_05660 [Shewanella sp. OPT22]
MSSGSAMLYTNPLFTPSINVVEVEALLIEGDVALDISTPELPVGCKIYMQEQLTKNKIQ